MSIRSDRWIRRMAEQHGMIEPYEPGQVKFSDKGGVAGQRIVSYGTSSYGYDCLLYTSPSPRDQRGSRMPSSA